MESANATPGPLSSQEIAGYFLNPDNLLQALKVGTSQRIVGPESPSESPV